MRMIRHDHNGVQVELDAVFLQAALKNDIPGFGRKSPSVVCRESNEERPIFFLDVGETTAVVILRLHEIAALWAA